MRVIWLPQAARRRNAAIERIAEDNIHAALSQLDRIRRQTARLSARPFMGRPSERRPATRILSIVGTPFVINYRILPDANRVEIIRFLHERQGGE